MSRLFERSKGEWRSETGKGRQQMKGVLSPRGIEINPERKLWEAIGNGYLYTKLFGTGSLLTAGLALLPMLSYSLISS